MNITIEKRKLSRAEAALFVSLMRKSPYMMSLSARKLLGVEDMYVATDDGKAIAISAFPYLGQGWYEWGPIYVLEKYRGTGVINDLITEGQPFIKKHKVFATTHNPKMKSILEKMGFSFVPVVRLPFVVFLEKLKYIISPFTWRQIIERKLKKQVVSKEDAGVCDPVYALSGR